MRCRARSGSGSRGFEVEAAGRRLEHDPLLGHRQGRAEAAADAAAEGEPLVGARLAVEPALGPELEGLRVEVLAVVEEQDADQDRRVGGTAYSPSRQGSFTRRPTIGTTGRERIVSMIVASIASSAPVAGADRLDQALVRVGVADQPLPGPGERVGGRLVAGEDQGEQLVADFVVGQLLALLGPRLQQQREDVAALVEVVGAAPRRRSRRPSAGRGGRARRG